MPSQHSQAAPGRLRGPAPSPRRRARKGTRGFAPEELYDHHLSAAQPFWIGVGDKVPPAPSKIHVHSGVEVAITLAGWFEFRFGQSTITAAAGEVGLCGMWEPHQALPLDPAGNSQVVAIFLPEFLASSARDAAPWMRLFAAGPEHRPQVRSAAGREVVLSIGRRLWEEIDGRASRWEEMIRLDLLRLLVVLEREWGKRSRGPGEHELYPAVADRLTPAVVRVHEDLSRRVSCAEAAAVCGFSEPHFRSLFRRTMGVGFGWFALRARLGVAAHCLTATGLPLRQIAESTGFSDLSHFHRMFEKHFGCNPTQYREESRETGAGITGTNMEGRQRFTSVASRYPGGEPVAPPRGSGAGSRPEAGESG